MRWQILCICYVVVTKLLQATGLDTKPAIYFENALKLPYDNVEFHAVRREYPPGRKPICSREKEASWMEGGGKKYDYV